MTKRYIVCPNCGMEYAPCEIYIPDEFFGKKRSFLHDGLDLVFNDDLLDTHEQYVCDNCNKKFDIEADIKFNTKLSKYEDIDFDGDYISIIKPDKV